MKLNKLEVEGFKIFSKKRVFNFKKGVNVIHGDNERGKSTVLEAIMAAIVGLKPGEIEGVKNWQAGDRCRVSLTYTTDDRDTFKIERDFLGGSNVLLKREKKNFKKITDVSRVINQKLEDHFGITDKRLLRATIFVRHKEMSSVEKESNRIKKNLSSLIAGATVNPVQTAVKKINAERKGLKYYRGKGGELYELKDRLEDAEKTLRQARGEEREVKTAEEEYRKKKKELEKKKEKVEALGSLLGKYDSKAKLEEDEEKIREQLKALSAVSEAGKRDPALLYVGAIVIAISLILAVLLSPWAAAVSLLGLVFFYFYFSQKTKVVVPKELREQRGRLNQDLAATRAGLRKYANVKLDPEEAEEKRKRHERLGKGVEKLGTEVAGLRAKVDTIKERSHDVSAAGADKESLEEKIEELKDRIKAFDLAVDFLQKAERKAYERVSPAMTKEASKRIKKITDGKYANLEITSDLEMRVKNPETGEFMGFKPPLSDGAQDQLYLAARLAISEVLSGGRKLPLLLDESLVFSDPHRFKNSMKILKDLSKTHPVVISSLYENYDEFADNVISL
jgi:DNA repair exonuclease SbcCD ATPase subunit